MVPRCRGSTRNTSVDGPQGVVYTRLAPAENSERDGPCCTNVGVPDDPGYRHAAQTRCLTNSSRPPNVSTPHGADL